MIGGDRGGDLERLNKALRDVREEPLSCLGAVELAERAVALEQAAAQLDAARCAVVAAASEAVEGPGAFKALGFRHAVDFIVDRSRCDARDIRKLDRVGRWLLDFPVFADAFDDGVLTHRHITELRSIDKPKVHHQLIDSQEMLVDAARELDFRDFVNVCAYWLNAADPDGDEPVEQAAKSGLSYKKHSDGSVSGKFRFDALTGQAIRNLLDQETQRLFRQDHEDGVNRSQGNRRGTALLNLMTRGSSKGGNSQITPLVHVVLGAALAENLAEQLAGETTKQVEPSFDDINRRCELIDGTPIHPKQAAVAMAAGMVRRTVFDEHSQPIDVAAKARGFPTWMKQTLLVRARGRCQIPGCDAPFAWLQADHVQPHSKGGPTKLANGQILCDPHNKWKEAS